MRIGEVAAQAGVHVQTIRFYERRGLLRQPQRLRSGYRDYPPEDVQIVRLIKQLQEHGFTLKEIETLLRLQSARAVQVPELRAHLQAKIDSLEVKIQALQAMRDKLKALTGQLAHDNGCGVLLFGLGLPVPPQSGAE
jgi:DNA-binding transcriptional MerR regulator